MHSLFQGKLAVGANLYLKKEGDNSLLFKTVESHLGSRGNCPLVSMLKKALINDAELLVNADILKILAKLIFKNQDATSITRVSHTQNPFSLRYNGIILPYLPYFLGQGMLLAYFLWDRVRVQKVCRTPPSLSWSSVLRTFLVHQWQCSTNIVTRH